MTELKEQLESVKSELANSMSLSDSLKQELEQVREREREVHMVMSYMYIVLLYSVYSYIVLSLRMTHNVLIVQ